MDFILKPLDPDPIEVLERWLPKFVASTDLFERRQRYLLFGSLSDYLSAMGPNDQEWTAAYDAIGELAMANDRELDNLLMIGVFETLSQGSVALNQLRNGLSGRARKLLLESLGETESTGRQ